MHEQKKVIVVSLIFVLLLTGGCSVFRRGVRSDSDERRVTGEAMFYRTIAENNICEGGVYIRRARIDAYFGGIRERFTVNMRISKDGRWLVSVRSIASIEVARIYADGKEVVILDRLGRTATVHGWATLKREYGVVYEMLPVILGDVPVSNVSDRRRIECGEFSDLEMGWASVRINPDCEVLKATTILLKDRISGREVAVASSAFSRTGSETYPAVVEATEKSGAFHVKLMIEAMEAPWTGNIDFEIPSNYRIIR